jgi:hypothetical protein
MKKVKSDIDLVVDINPSVIFRPCDGEITVIDLESDAWLHSISGVAAKVWLKIDGKKTVAELIDAIADQEKIKQADRPFLKIDVVKFVDDLLKQDLIVPKVTKAKRRI